MSDVSGIRPNVQTFVLTDQGQYFAQDLHSQSQVEGTGHQSYHLPPPAPLAIPQEYTMVGPANYTSQSYFNPSDLNSTPPA